MLYKLLKARRSLGKNPYRKLEELKKLQQKQLRKEIHIAYENVEYYHRLFKSLNLKPNDIETKEDLQKLPITDKSVIRNHNLVSEKVRNQKLFRLYTSGTTGEPIEVIYTENDFATAAVIASRSSEAAGYKTLKDRLALVNMIGPFAAATCFDVLFKGFIKLFAKGKMISIKKPASEIADELVKFNPTILSTYPSVAYILGLYFDKEGIELPYLKSIVTSSELINEKTRRRIEESLNAELFDSYGMTEIWSVGYECPEHTGLHINMDAVVLEVVDIDDNPVAEGERGRLIVTPLMREGMPLIRYDTHDVIRMGSEGCSCGRTTPLIEIIEGRVEDIISLPDGSVIYPQIIIGELGDLTELANYQVIQQEANTIEVSIVKGKNFSEITEKKVERICKDIFGEVNLKINFTERVEETPSARMRHIISRVGEGSP